MTIPDTIVNDLMTSTASILGGFAPVIIILLGIGIVFYLSKGILELLPK